MPNERISMSKLKQLIGLQASNLSVRAMARALGLSVGAVSKYLRAVRACGIERGRGRDALGRASLSGGCSDRRWRASPARSVPPDCAWIHGELKRHRHVTLQLLWEEYAGALRRGGLPAQRVLPDLSALGEAAEALDAPAALRRREAVRRLRRPHGADLRRRAARRRSGRTSSSARWARAATRTRRRRAARRCRTGSAATCGRWSFMGRPRRSSCPTTRKVGVTQGGSLRAGAAALVRGNGRSLPLRGDPGAAVSAEG